MTSDAGSQSSPPAETAGEEGRIRSLEERFGAIETEQKEQRGIMARIEAALTGGRPKANPGASAQNNDGGMPQDSSTGSGMSVAEQVRRGVEEIEAKKQRDADEKAAKDADSAWRKNVDERLAERRPAEPATGRKTKVQRALFGKADAR